MYINFGILLVLNTMSTPFKKNFIIDFELNVVYLIFYIMSTMQRIKKSCKKKVKLLKKVFSPLDFYIFLTNLLI